MQPKISVIILTFHRPQGALNAVRSVLKQKTNHSFEIILMDNDKNASGKEASIILANEAKEKNINFQYSIEPKAGVANARNSAIKLANGEFIAFLDDDEVAFEDWLEKLLLAYETTKAEVIFGPIEARLEEGSSKPLNYFKEFFSRLLDGETRIIEKPYGCGNCLILKDKVFYKEEPFNVLTNETGGEDDFLWADVKENGGHYGWAKDAWVYEDVPKKRANYQYLSARAFSYAHAVSGQYFFSSEKNYLLGFISIFKGIIQTISLGMLALILFAINHEKRAWAYDKMIRGLGKVFFFGPFRVKLYGEAVEKNIKKFR